MTTSAQGDVPGRTLKGLLDGLLVAHRQDIHAFSGGHLNESNLKKSEAELHKPWSSSQKPRPVLVARSELRKSSGARAGAAGATRKSQEHMTSTIAAFSLGATAGVPSLDQPKVALPRVKSSGTAASAKSRDTDNVLIEEIRLPEVMLARTEYFRPGEKGGGDTGRDMESYFSPRVKQSPRKKDGDAGGDDAGDGGAAEFTPRHRFLSGHQEAVTRKDQYRKMKEFEWDVLRKQDTTERKVLTGAKAVEHHEQRLAQSLEEHGATTSYEPSIEILQLYSDTFDDVIAESTSLGYMLQRLKSEHDAYVTHLLQAHSGRHLVLQDQVRQLTSRASHRPQTLSQEQQKLAMLEADTKDALELNERLRHLVEEERARSESQPSKPLTATIHYSEPALEAADHIEEAHAEIMSRLDDVIKEREELRHQYVPASIVTHLEQSIKDTEVEIQKLTSKKEYFVRSTNELEAELNDVINEADTTERDARRIWKKLASVKQNMTSTSQGEGYASQLQQEDSDDEYNEENKWNWYIS